jgi:hypothetical protein
MAMTAGEIVDQARDYSPLFTRQAVPDLPALKTLSRLQRQLAAAVADEAPDVLAVWHDVELPLPAGWEDGISLPPHSLAFGAEVGMVRGGVRGTWEVSLLNAAQSQTQPHLFPSMSIMGGKLFLTDARKWRGTSAGWEDIDSLRVRLVPEMSALESLDSLISLPDTAESPLAALLALWMADRVGARLPTIRETAGGAASDWVRSMVATGSTRVWMVEVVE